MKTLSRNKNNDLFISGNTLAVAKDAEAKCDIIESIILTQQGELQFDAEAGIDYFGTVFQNPRYVTLWAAQVQSKIKSLDWVSRISDFQYKYDAANSSLIWSMTVITTDGNTLTADYKRKKSDDILKYEVKWDSIYNKDDLENAIQAVGAMTDARNSIYGEDKLTDGSSWLEAKRALNNIVMRPNGARDTDETDEIRLTIQVSASDTRVALVKDSITASGKWWIDWGDGKVDYPEDLEAASSDTGADIFLLHKYDMSGTYSVSISGAVTEISGISADAYSAHDGNPRPCLCTNCIDTEGGAIICAKYSAILRVSIGKDCALTEIGDYAFAGCSSLQNIVINRDVTTIGNGAFIGCSALANLEWMPVSVASLGTGCFKQCTGLSSLKRLFYTGVTAIPDQCFAGCSKLESLAYLPLATTTIGTSAFEGCSKAQDAYISSTCTSIGSKAFAGCSKLIAVRSDASSRPNVEADSFSDIASGKTLYVPNGKSSTYNGWGGFTYVSGGASNNIKEWGSITIEVKDYSGANIPTGTKIISSICSSCPQTINFGANNNQMYALNVMQTHEWSYVTETNSGANGYTIEIKGYIENIEGCGPDRQSGCVVLDGYENTQYLSKFNAGSMPSLTTIGSYCFAGCVQLTDNNLNIGTNCSVISNSSFYNCTGLSSLGFLPTGINFKGSDGVPTVSHCFDGCTGLTSISRLNSCTQITALPAYCFANCSNLNPNSALNSRIQVFLEGCFANSGLTSLAVIPTAVTRIGNGCFSGCASLTSISRMSSMTAITALPKECFMDCTALESLEGCNNIQIVGEKCFMNCTSVKSLNGLGVNVQNDVVLATQAFMGSGLEGLDYLPLNAASITLGKWCFRNTNITETNVYRTVPPIVSEESVGGLSGTTIYVLPEAVSAYTENRYWRRLNIQTRSIAFTSSQAETIYVEVKSTSPVAIKYGDTITIASTNSTGFATVNSSQVSSFILMGGIIGIEQIGINNTFNTKPSYLTSCAVNDSMRLEYIANADGTGCFEGIGTLKNVTLAFKAPTATVTPYIGSRAFKDCTTLGTVSFQSGSAPYSIGSAAFSGCTSLTTVENATEVITVGASAFYECTGLISVAWLPNVMNIGDSAFQGCTGLLTIEGLDSLPAVGSDSGSSADEVCIGANAFAGCTGLISVLMAQTEPPLIDADAFGSSNVDTVLYVPAESIDAYKAAQGWDRFGNNVFPIGMTFRIEDVPEEGLTILGNCAKVVASGEWAINWGDGNIEKFFGGTTLLPSHTYAYNENGYTIEIIGPISEISSNIQGTPFFATEEGKKFEFLTAVSISASTGLKTIGSNCFCNCTELTEVDFLGGTVEVVGNNAFRGCTSLATLTGLYNVSVVRDFAFANCSSLTGLSAFLDNSLSGNSLGDSSSEDIKAVMFGDSSFMNCTSLRTCNGVYATSAAAFSFYGCSSLEDVPIFVPRVDIGSGTLFSPSIGGSAFFGCSSLTALGVESVSAVTSVGEAAFYGCTSLEDISGFTNLQTLGDSAFEGLTSITSLETLNKVENIGARAFYGCSGIISVKGLSGVSNIGDYAFYGCNLTEIDGLNKYIVSIGDFAFATCPLQRIIMDAVKPPLIGENTFFGVDKTTIELLVPLAGLANYQNSALWANAPINYWAQFTNIAPSQYIKFYLSDIPESGLVIDGRTAKMSVAPFEWNETVYDPSTLENVTTTTTYNYWAIDWGDGSAMEVYDNSITSLPRHMYDGSYTNTVITISGVIKSISALGADACPFLCEQDETTFPFLTKVEVANRVPLEEVGEYCFYNNTNLSQFIINSDEALTIGPHAFENTALGTLQFMSGRAITSIGDYSFARCTHLTDISAWPSNITTIPEGCFIGCTALETMGYDETRDVSRDTSSADEVPAWFSTVQVISAYCFKGCTALVEVPSLPALRTFGEESFYGCTSLTTVHIGANVGFIGDGAFGNCPNITGFTIDDAGAGFINENGILAKEITAENKVLILLVSPSVTQLTIPFNIDSNDGESDTDITYEIADGALAGCTNLKTLSIGDNVEFKYDVFNDCTGITNLTIGMVRLSATESRNIAALFPRVYSNLTTIALVAGTDTRTAVPAYAFKGCSHLTNVSYPSEITTLGASVFEGCTSLSSLSLSNITSIGASAFKGCTGLLNLSIPSAVTSVGAGAFEGCTGFSNIAIEGVTAIPDNLFKDCANLQNITLASGGISSIGAHCFDHTAIVSLEFLKNKFSGTSIGDGCFANCTSLSDITEFPSTITSIPAYCFYNCPNLRNVVLRIPSNGSIGAYAFAIPTSYSGTYNCNISTLVFTADAAPTAVYTAFSSTNGTVAQISGSAILKYPYGGAGFNTAPWTTLFYSSNIVPLDPRFEITLTGVPAGTWVWQGMPLSQTEGDGPDEYYIDWGDGSDIQAIDRTTSQTEVQHLYEVAGTFTVSISGVTTLNGLPINGHTETCFGWGEYTSGSSTGESEAGPSDKQNQGCSYVTKLKINDIFDAGIDNGYFRDCTGFTTIETDTVSALKKIGYVALFNTGIVALAQPKLTNIGAYACCNCTALTTVQIPAGVQTIGEFAFAVDQNTQSALSSLTLADGITTIDTSAFMYCAALTNVVIPKSINSLKSFVFSACTKLTAVTMIGKTMSQVNAMKNKYWGLPSDCTITCSDGNITVSS